MDAAYTDKIDQKEAPEQFLKTFDIFDQRQLLIYYNDFWPVRKKNKVWQTINTISIDGLYM